MIEVTVGSSMNSSAEMVWQARAHARLTQAELARRVDTTQSAVSRWERGHDEPRTSTLSALLQACGLRLTLRADVDDVDRAQLRQQLAMTPQQRLASVTNLSRTLASARRAG